MTAFVSPTTGETVWYVSNGVSKPLFQGLLDAFAKETGAGARRTLVLVLDNAGWHTEPGLVVPEGLRLVHLPPYSPELQPAECLWQLVDEPIVNQHFNSLVELQAVIDDRCRSLQADPQATKAATNFHWWPNVPTPT